MSSPFQAGLKSCATPSRVLPDALAQSALMWRRLRVASILALLIVNVTAGTSQVPAPGGQLPGPAGPPPPAPPAGTVTPGATAIIRGHVTGIDGRPLRQAQVKFVASLTGQTSNETTDADGAYEAGGLRADTYTVTASKAGYVAAEFGQRRLSYPGTRVRVANGEVVERIDVILLRTGAIAGRVSDEAGDPIEGATVSLLGVQFVGGRRTLAEIGRRTSNDLGRFRLFGVQPGQYVVAAAAASAGPRRLPGYATTYYPGSPSVADAQVITVTAGDDQAGVEIRLLPGRASKISGIVVDSRGDPYRGALVLAGSERSGALALPPVRAGVRPDGTFEILNVGPGDYVLQAIERPALGGAFATQFVSVGDGDVNGIAMRTGTGSKVAGHITLEGKPSGVGPPDFQFMFLQTDFDLGPVTGTYRAKINDDWTFEYVGLYGPLLIRPIGPPEWLVKSIHAGATDITDTPMMFGRQDQSLADVEVVLTNLGTQVAGTVTDARGHAVSACTAVVFPLDRSRWERLSRFIKAARCDPDGTFLVRGLPSSEYFAAAVDRLEGTERAGEWQDPAFLEPLVAGATRVMVNDGQTATVTAKLIVR